MRTILKQSAPAALLVLLACQPKPAAPIYGPWEEGLTLTFEDPSKPQPLRSAERMQVRVTRATLNPGAPALVQVNLASTRGQMNLNFRYQEGGIALVDDQGQLLAQPLPVGVSKFSQWVDRGVQYRVIGRAAWDGAAILPATSDPVGVWVESRPPQGLPRRTLFLPNLGEVESREERNGTWVVINRLVARGFTDLPILKRPS
jgi:hypothetical protein